MIPFTSIGNYNNRFIVSLFMALISYQQKTLVFLYEKFRI
jgi:hypothetical protein